jgi:F-type H+-transporting ATPase subunit b
MQLTQLEPGLMLWTIIVFLVLLALLRKFAWAPLLASLEQRQDLIRKSLDDAQQARKELERLNQESAQILKNANAEAESIVSRSWSEAEKLREEMKQKARTDADAIMKEAQRQIEIETGRAVRQIRNEVADISVNIASKLIQRNFSREDNSRLIEDTLKQIEAGKLQP